MLWIETHKPKSFSEMTSHLEVINKLRNYTIEDIPNIIFHGQPGHNRKTLVYALINHLYKKYPEPVSKNSEIIINSKNITINYLETENMVQITPSEYGTKDRHVIQNLIKKMVESRPVLSLLGFKRHSIKVLVIDRAECLSRDAQAALRITMEKYSQHFRIFMICTEISKLIEPIRSRSIFFRIRGFTSEEIFEICKCVLEKERQVMPDDVVYEIAKNGDGNCKRALCVLELHSYMENDNENKKQKLDMKNFKLEWEIQIDRIVDIIKKSQGVESFLEIRKEFYALLKNGISGDLIIRYMARKLITDDLKINSDLSDKALIYEERIKLGTKDLLHLEAFAASAMKLFSNKKNFQN